MSKLTIPAILLTLGLTACTSAIKDDLLETKALLQSSNPESKQIIVDSAANKYFNKALGDYSVSKQDVIGFRENAVLESYRLDNLSGVSQGRLVMAFFDANDYKLGIADKSGNYVDDVPQFDTQDSSLAGVFAAGFGERVNGAYVDDAKLTPENLEWKLSEPGDGIIVSDGSSVRFYHKDKVSQNLSAFAETIRGKTAIQTISLIADGKIDMEKSANQYSLLWGERSALVMDQEGEHYLFLSYKGRSIGLFDWAVMVENAVKQYHPEMGDNFNAAYLECGTHGYFAVRDNKGDVTTLDRGLMPVTQIEVRQKN